MSAPPTAAPDPLPRQLRWLGRGAGLLVVWLLLWGIFALGEGDANPALLAVAVVGAGAVTWGATLLAPNTETMDWTPPYVPTSTLGGRDPRFSRLSRLLSEATDRATVSDEVHHTLRQLTAERLERLHNVDIEQHPDQARSLLGSELYDYLTRPARRIRGNEVAVLSRHLSRIEAL